MVSSAGFARRMHAAVGLPCISMIQMPPHVPYSVHAMSRPLSPKRVFAQIAPAVEWCTLLRTPRAAIGRDGADGAHEPSNAEITEALVRLRAELQRAHAP